MLYSVLFFFFNVYSFIFCNHFILVWAMADLKPIPGKMGIHPGWDKSIIHIFIHSFSPRHNLFRPTHLLPCFWEVGKKKKSVNTWETYKDTGPNGKLQTDSNPCSGPNWGLWSCEVAILFAVPPFWNIFLCYKLRDMASLIMSFNYTGAREYLENRF